ncbi:hypothetical protein HU200_033604 [Digitaria exilis]|uniref:H(+)/Pi cotransporter n=1 Tax=Digitaria exilis TaxID=1010633 RepID=A0A835EKL8_9POAL|nr:hypothetical protein HU200_033604 [Digitaria exilis]
MLLERQEPLMVFRTKIFKRCCHDIVLSNVEAYTLDCVVVEFSSPELLVTAGQTPYSRGAAKAYDHNLGRDSAVRPPVIGSHTAWHIARSAIGPSRSNRMYRRLIGFKPFSVINTRTGRNSDSARGGPPEPCRAGGAGLWRTQMYHLKAIAIAGMGFFTGAYDLFCISTVSKLLGRLYFQFQYDEENPHRPTGRQPVAVEDMVIGVALVGTFMEQLVFGYLGDKLGRKRVYGITLTLMASCAVGSALSFGSTEKSVLGTLYFFRFWLGFGIGGEYPLSATIMCEYANKRTRGAFMGIGIVFAGLVSMVVSAIFLHYNPAPAWREDRKRARLVPGARDAVLADEVAGDGEVHGLVEGDGKQAAMDMQAVLDVPIAGEQEKISRYRAANDYPLLSCEFTRRHGLHLVGTSTTWFLLEITFYCLNLTQKDVFLAIRLTSRPENLNALREVFQISRAMFLVALLGTCPATGSPRQIQLIGFFMMSVFLLAMGVMHGNHNRVLFALLHALTLFFASFGPNCTTFVLAAELFPARLCSTCHAISAASGMAGAITTAYAVQNLNLTGSMITIKKAIIMLAITNFLGFFMTFLIPETMGRSLEEISGEDDNASISADAAEMKEDVEEEEDPPVDYDDMTMASTPTSMPASDAPMDEDDV